jgi:hypothetical protein
MEPLETGDWIQYADYELLRQEFSLLAEERYTTIRALELDVERLKRAGDAFLGTYVHACAKRLVDEQTAIKVVTDWTTVKRGTDK